MKAVLPDPCIVHLCYCCILVLKGFRELWCSCSSAAGWVSLSLAWLPSGPVWAPMGSRAHQHLLQGAKVRLGTHFCSKPVPVLRPQVSPLPWCLTAMQHLLLLYCKVTDIKDRG